ncbi:MAG: glycoside hydrolase family 43 protein [Clostridia bacterium]|nr:glycoside hydrolase family 43 protein [Clostridia bacterium]
MKTGKKLFASFLGVLMLCLFIPFAGTLAADKVVYLDPENGNDGSSGQTPQTALASLPAAITAAAEGGRIVLLSDLKLTEAFEEPAHSGEIVITAQNGGTDSGATLTLPSNKPYSLGGPTVFEDLRIGISGGAEIAARFFPLTMGEGLTLSSSALTLVGGYEAPADGTPTAKDSHITIKSGSYRNVVGFSRTKGAKTQTYTGTAYITVYDGKIEAVYGASLYNHYSGSLVFQMYGGSVLRLYTGGDVTRRLSGTSVIEIYGGSVSAFNINNACGNTDLKLDGGSLDKVTESIYENNDTITKLAANAKRYLTYNPLAYPKEKIDELAATGIFDRIASYGSVCLSDGGTGDGSSENAPLGSLADAVKKLPMGGALTVVGTYTVPADTTLPAHEGEIVCSGGTLVLPANGTLSLSGDFRFASLTLSGEGAALCGSGSLSLAKDVKTSGKIRLIGTADPEKGCNLTVEGGEFDTVFVSKAGTKAGVKTILSLAGGKIGTVKLKESGSFSGDVSVSVSGAEIGELDLREALGSLSLEAVSGKIGAVHAGPEGLQRAESAAYTLVYAEKVFSETLFAELTPLLRGKAPEKVVYLADGGTGNGATPTSPLGTLKDAFAALKTAGGRIVVCGVYSHTETPALPVCAAPVTITAKDGETDYRTQGGGQLRLSKNLTFPSSVYLENVNLYADVSGVSLIFAAVDAGIGSGVSVFRAEGVDSYPHLIAGKAAGFSDLSYTFTVASGTFRSLYLSSSKADSTVKNAQITARITKGEFTGPVYAMTPGAQTGSVSLTVDGGVFRAGIYGVGAREDASFSGTFSLTLNGGSFYGKIAPAYYAKSTLNGDYELAINGGTFHGVTDVIGPEAFGGTMTPHITVGAGVDLFAGETGTSSFDNPITTAADPWVIYQDGYYYFTRTAGSAIGVAKATNLADLRYAPLVTVFAPAAGQAYSKNLWSPELHYYGPEVFGEELAGWYIHLACDDGDNSNHRMYVIRALTDDPQGPYGHPVTKQQNVPVAVTSDTTDEILHRWCAGQTTGIIRGELYCLWVSENHEEVNHRYQTLNISKMKSPWELTGRCSVICVPTEPWEKVGATYTVNAEGKIWPEVVEGIAVTTAPDGTVYLLYAGSGYWTTGYCIGQLTLKEGADPTYMESWVKASQPILSRNTEANGCGHCCFTVSPDGKKQYIIYHGYLGGAAGGSRYLMAEEYAFTKDGVRIVDGEGKTYTTSDGKLTQPPLATVFTTRVNPMPLAEKLVKGWGSAIDLTPPVAPAETDAPDSGTGTVPGDSDGVTGSSFPWVPVLIGAGVLAAAAVAAVLLGKKKKN